MSTLVKDTLRLIQKTKGRFFSLAAIVMIGVAFFVGVSSSSSIMAANVDAYDDQYNMKDITVYSNYGFDEDDIRAAEKLPDVDKAETGRFADVYISSGSYSSIARIHSYDPAASINRFSLREGRLPEKKNEVLGEAGTDMEPGLPVGSVIKLSRPENDLEDWLSVSEVTVVGTIDTPLYINMTKENSTLSNQYLQTYFYIPKDAFTNDFDIEMNVLISGGKSYNSFYGAYQDYADSVKTELEDLGKTRAELRREDVLSAAWDKYNDGLREYEDGLNEFNTKIADAEKEISDAEKELADGKKQLADGERELNDAQQELLEAEEDGRKKLEEGREQLEAGEAELEEGKKKYEEGKEEAEGYIKQIDEGIAEIDEALVQLQSSEVQQAVSLLREFPPDTDISELIATYRSLKERIDEVKDEYGEITEITVGEVAAHFDQISSQIRTNIQDLRGHQGFADHLSSAYDHSMALSELNEMLDAQDRQKLSDMQDDISLWVTDASYETLQDVLNSYSQALSRADNAEQSLERTGSLLNDIDEEMMDVSIFASAEEAESKLNQLTEALRLMNPDNQFKTTGDLVAAYDSSLSQLNQKRKELADTRKMILDELEAAYQKIKDGEEQLEKARQEIADGTAELETQIADAQKQIDEGRAELEKNRKKLNDGEIELADAKSELEDARVDGLKELNDAKEKLDKAKQDIEELEQGSWTVLTREQHYHSRTYKNTVQQMQAIANIFPIFFFLVAALVCLTTMTRMVDEQRGQIGIMMALGYTPLQCASKYLSYAAIATLIGEVTGAFLGLMTLPAVIYNAWNMMYVQPQLKIYVPWPLILLSSASFLAVMMLTTWYSCAKDMKEVPAQLLRPKAPKVGRSTMIEKAEIIWSHLSFTWKVTIRNLIRYKKRLIMTVIGVGGCTALLITGFGIRDSINSMVDIQFDELVLYDGTAVFSEDFSYSRYQSYAAQIERNELISSVALAGSYSAMASAGKNEETVYVQTFADDEAVSELYRLRTRKGHTPLHLTDEGIIISEKLAENMEVKAGDEMMIESRSGVKRKIPIAAVCEMYIQHYVFMTEACYRNYFGASATRDTILVKAEEGADLEEVKQLLSSDEHISSISFYDAILENFKSMVGSLDLIVWVLIAASMSLAFVVLGNLTNINISERQREIATLKVLGFTGKEVEDYIYKENNVLTFLGSLLGIPIGNMLHHYIMRQVEMDYIMFGRSVMKSSFMISVAMTLLFGLLVNFFMRKKLSQIEMVESLKSVE